MRILEIYNIIIEKYSYDYVCKCDVVEINFRTSIKIKNIYGTPSFDHSCKVALSKFLKLKKPEDIKELLIEKVIELSVKNYKENKILEFNNYSKKNKMKLSYDMDSLFVAEEL